MHGQRDWHVRLRPLLGVNFLSFLELPGTARQVQAQANADGPQVPELYETREKEGQGLAGAGLCDASQLEGDDTNHSSWPSHALALSPTKSFPDCSTAQA